MSSTTVTKQQHYRRLMKEQKASSRSSQQDRVNHPLARYNALDQLMCVVCGLHIKSKILWPTHLQSRKHKDSVAALKAQKSAPASAPVPQSRKVEEEETTRPLVPSGKRKLPDQSNDGSNNGDLPPPTKKKKKSKHLVPSATPAPTNSGLPAGFFDAGVSKTFHPDGEEVMYVSSDSEEEAPPQHEDKSTLEAKMAVATVGAIPPPSGLPTDFFDRGDESKSSNGSKSIQNPKGSLPEGFFDDPKMDAKVRKVEYKDPMTEEWERFQKSMQKEDDVSEAILFEGDEETMEERDLEEVNQQVTCFTKAEQLRQKHEELINKKAQQIGLEAKNASDQNQMELSSSDDEVDFDEFLNWRAKIS